MHLNLKFVILLSSLFQLFICSEFELVKFKQHENFFAADIFRKMRMKAASLSNPFPDLCIDFEQTSIPDVGKVVFTLKFFQIYFPKLPKQVVQKHILPYLDIKGLVNAFELFKRAQCEHFFPIHIKSEKIQNAFVYSFPEVPTVRKILFENKNNNEYIGTILPQTNKIFKSNRTILKFMTVNYPKDLDLFLKSKNILKKCPNCLNKYLNFWDKYFRKVRFANLIYYLMFLKCRRGDFMDGIRLTIFFLTIALDFFFGIPLTIIPLYIESILPFVTLLYANPFLIFPLSILPAICGTFHLAHYFGSELGLSPQEDYWLIPFFQIFKQGKIKMFSSIFINFISMIFYIFAFTKIFKIDLSVDSLYVFE